MQFSWGQVGTLTLCTQLGRSHNSWELITAEMYDTEIEIMVSEEEDGFAVFVAGRQPRSTC